MSDDYHTTANATAVKKLKEDAIKIGLLKEISNKTMVHGQIPYMGNQGGMPSLNKL